MTVSTDVENDSLSELKAQRDELSRMRSRVSKAEAGHLVAQHGLLAAKSFTKWFHQQHQVGGIALPADGRIEVQPALSRSFCIGMHDLRYFIGIPKACASWFLDMPWLQAEVSDGSSWLALRCKQYRTSSIELPSFGLFFNVQPDGYMSRLMHYHYLDVRVIEQIPASGGSFAISREVYLTLTVCVAKSSSALRGQPVSSGAPALASLVGL